MVQNWLKTTNVKLGSNKIRASPNSLDSSPVNQERLYEMSIQQIVAYILSVEQSNKPTYGQKDQRCLFYSQVKVN